MSPPTTDGITIISAIRDEIGRATIGFRSIHAERCHQLYANGELVAWTDRPEARRFTLAGEAATRECVIAAVSAADRMVDLSAELGISPPAWVVQRRLARTPDWPRDGRVELLGDGASGTFRSAPLASADTWPAWAPRWAWGEDRFGRGAFGWDGSAAPGAGLGAMGGGMFGFDERSVTLPAALGEPGTHQLKLRLRGPGGTFADGPVETLDVQPPPDPPAAVTLADYDPATRRITLNIQGATP